MIQELSSKELQQYITSSKSCQIGDSCVLESKFGKIKFNFVGNYVHKIGFYFKRISGNGKAIIKYGDKNTDIIIHSKISQLFEVECDNNEIEIYRPSDGLGEVSIFGIILHDNIVENNGDTLANNWKNLIARCGKYSALRMSNNKLFASSGATIENGKVVKNITTSPPNSWERAGDKVKFRIACEILDIQINEDFPILTPEHKTSFIHHEHPMPLLPMAPEIESKIQPLKTSLPDIVYNKKPANIYNPVLYDSFISKEFNTIKNIQTKTLKFITSNGKDYILIRKGGFYTLPTSFVRVNYEYVIVLTLKRINGNGKLQLGFTGPGQPLNNPTTIMADTQTTDQYIKIRTDILLNPGELYRLSFGMGDNGSGEVLVERIRIIDGVSVNSVQDLNRVYSNYESYIPSNSTNINTTYGLGYDISDDFVNLTLKKYSRLTNTTITSRNLETQTSVTPLTLSALFWINKIKPYFKGLTITSKNNLSNSLIIGKIGSLIYGKKYWLEPFDLNDFKQEDKDNLSGAQTIFSPSISNIQFLQNTFPETKCILSHKPWAYTQSKEIPYLNGKSFILAFNRNYKTTKFLIEAHGGKLPLLVLIGGKGNYPDYVLPFNEYLSYSKLMYLIQNAICLVDLPTHTDYISSILHLANSCGTPIVSTNWFVMDKNNSTFLIPENKEDKIIYPNKENLLNGICKYLEYSKPNMLLNEKYNDNLNILF